MTTEETPGSLTAADAAAYQRALPFFVMAPRKFLWLYLATFGL